MNRAALDEIIGQVSSRLAGGEPPTPIALTFLLRGYARTDRADIRVALEPALAMALDLQTLAHTVAERAAWLAVFADALVLSADDRLRDSAAGLIAGLRRDWGRPGDVACGALSADACLRASRSMESASLAADAIDELERIVGAAYQPGAGLTGREAVESGSLLADHIAVSSALLTAFDVSARLPYPMLAEELMQFARRKQWDATAGCFAGPDRPSADIFQLNCQAARVLSGLAMLHRDADYVKAAVIGPDAAYLEDAGRILASLEAAARAPGADRAAFGLALMEWLDL